MCAYLLSFGGKVFSADPPGGLTSPLMVLMAPEQVRVLPRFKFWWGYALSEKTHFLKSSAVVQTM